MLTASSFPSAALASHCGIDILLTGDSLAMVHLGLTDTSALTLAEMLMFCRAVARGARDGPCFLVGDLPMGSYEISPAQALTSAIRMIKEGRQHAVKLEGGVALAPTIRHITTAGGIPVLAHIGLTPQRQHSLGGFRVQGKTTASALQLLEDALAVQNAGAFAVVLEAVPPQIARIITSKLHIPTIGIGAGNATSGQVLVQADMLGDFPPGRGLPKFVKRYGDVWGEGCRAVEAYVEEVKRGTYPREGEHTYAMPEKELAEFERVVARVKFPGREEEAGKEDQEWEKQ